MRVYFDNAATTPISEEVLAEMMPFLRNNYGNPSSTHQEGRTAKAGIEKARKAIAAALNATTSEIVFTSGGTEANNTAIKCAVRDLGVTRIISSEIEHSCVFNTVNRMGRADIRVEYVKLDGFGRADLNHLTELLQQNKEKTLVSLMHANNEVGTLNAIETIGTLCHQYGALFHTDTVQTVGHIPLDVSSGHYNFISGSGHKLHGPKGVGFLYINKQNAIECLIDGGGQERQMRSGTENVASIIGLGKAISTAIDDLHARMEHIQDVRSYFMDALLHQFPETKFNGDAAGQCLCTVLNVAFKTSTPVNILLFKLDLAGISASGGSACNSGAVGQSRVLGKLNTQAGYESVRFSFSHFNTRNEVDFTIEKLKQIL